MKSIRLPTAEYQKSRRVRLKAMGLCVQCSAPAVNKNHCIECREKARIRGRKYTRAKLGIPEDAPVRAFHCGQPRKPIEELSRQRRWQIQMASEGKCVICAQPSVNKHHCEHHRAVLREYGRKYYRLRTGGQDSVELPAVPKYEPGLVMVKSSKVSRSLDEYLSGIFAGEEAA